MGSDANLTRDRMGAFLQIVWKHNPGEWGLGYFDAIRVYNTSTSAGIRAEDFTDCWFHFDICAFNKFYNQGGAPQLPGKGGKGAAR